MNKKSILLAIIAFVAVVALFVTVYFVTRPTGQEGEKTFTVTIVHSDGATVNKTITSTQAFLAPALRDNGIIGDEGISTGMYNTVDGETANWDPDHAYWSIYIDGEYAMVGLNDISIQEGQVYKLVYTVDDYGG